ncbi:ribonuclease HII [candidate division WOR-3 bacterium]|nr:ribonuclease HII [candidate division WOR-3 bacterium]
MKIIGIDEAGRGPAIGPMIMAGVLYDDMTEDRLKSLGVRDSKKLSSSRRELLEPQIKESVMRYWIAEISVSLIDRKNLNTLELEAAASIIREADAETVFLDVPVAENSRYKFIDRLRKAIQKDIPIVAKSHADDIFPCVSAASILAKVERDRLISNLHSIYGDFGSGYPGDSKTQVFISEWYRYPEIIRKRWQPVRDVIVRKGKIMIVGGRDTGKTEFARELVNIGIKKGLAVGVLDLDPGQSHIGPPGTLGFGVADKRIRRLEQISPLLTFPVFSLSPSGCEERILTGIEWFKKKVPQVDLLIIDTSGYIRDLNFKRSKIKLINPDSVVFIEHKMELDELKKGLGSIIYSIPVYEGVRKKSRSSRKAFRMKSKG